MSDRSKIEWTDTTWNPTRGCTKIAQGCKNCYAETFAERWRGIPGHPYEHGFDPRIVPEKLTEPLKWKKPRRIFVDSMSDLFHEAFSFEYISAVFGVMAACPQHTFQVLTKRPARALEFFRWFDERLNDALIGVKEIRRHGFDFSISTLADTASRWPLPNVWIGTSIATQKDADQNTILLQIPAAVRFLSAEPLIEAVDLTRFFYVGAEGGIDYAYSRSQLVSWLIVGGESGHGARPCNVEWIRSIVEQCKAAGVPCFVKQLGAKPYDGDFFFETGQTRHDCLSLRDRKGGNWDEWPADLRVREFPEEVTR